MKVAQDFTTSPRTAENVSPSNPRRMYDSYWYNGRQQNSSRGMASAIEVPLRDATPSVVPSLHFPHESNPPAFAGIATQSGESMVSEMVGFSKIKFSESGLWTFEQNPEQINENINGRRNYIEHPSFPTPCPLQFCN